MKHKRCLLYTFLSVFAFFLFPSCGSKRNIVYFQSENQTVWPGFNSNRDEYKSVIMPFDNLFITVTSDVNPTAVEVFNPMQNRSSSLTPASIDIFGYLVDHNGNINLPLAGELHVAGLTKTEAVKLLQDSISKYAEGVVVNIRLMNFKFSVFGEVNRPGTYTITDERISIPQAIAMAGDLTIYGQRRDVKLIRNENGEEKFYNIDLTSTDVFLSPYYYLRQNDVLYISPNKTRAGSSTYNQNLPLIVSVINVTITAIALYIRYK